MLEYVEQPGSPVRMRASYFVEPGRPAPPSDSSDGGAPAGIDFEDRWRRAVADLDNVRKRQARDLVQERLEHMVVSPVDKRDSA